MADVAEAAGVSAPTVSKVLRGKMEISSQTRARVLQAIRDTGYVANFVRTETTGVIDLVIDGIDSMWALDVVRGAEEAAGELGYSLIVTSTYHGSLAPRDWLRRIAQRRTDGVVAALTRLNGETVSLLTSLNAPLVMLDPIGASNPGIPTVSATNWLGGLTATMHLLSLGHRRIGVITGPREMAFSQERLEGYLAALARQDVPVDRELIRWADFLVEGGREASATLLDLKDPPTAIFAASDPQAAGVYQEARSRSLHIPDDLSVVGFDDSALCEMLSPPLTTIRQPIVELAHEAVRLVHRLIGRSEPSENPTIQLATTLVERSSSTFLKTSRDRDR